MLVSEILTKVNHLVSSGFNDKAITLLGDHFLQQKENPQIHFQLIHLLQQQGDFENSDKVLIDAENKFGNLIQLILLKSNQQKGLGNHSQAINYLYQYLELNQENPLVWATLAQLLEQLNRLNELQDLFEKVPTSFSKRPLIALVNAKLLRRQSNYQQALQVLDSIENNPTNPWLLASIKFEYSRVYDKLEEYDKAWDSAKDANNKTSLVWPNRWQKSTQIDEMLEQTSSWRLEQNAVVNKTKSPCFLIGFPRSGTTLLDRILDSHQYITVLNEQPLIEKIVKQLGGFDYLSKLETLTSDDVQFFREQYLREFKEIHPAVSDNDVWVDKLPLNILYLPLITTIFPDSKIILSIRHPLDSCLSCFFQEFISAPALSNFLNFEKTVKYYDQIFSSTEAIIDKNLNVFQIRYEAILADLESSISSLLEGLDLEWQPQLKTFYKQAEDQPINTPSYYQVVKPLYKDSMYRWKNYQSKLNASVNNLQYWIDKFGY